MDPTSAPIRGYRRPATDCHPPNDSPDYRSTTARHPARPLVVVPQTLSEITGPVYGHDRPGPTDHDLTRQHGGEPLGERIIVAGRVLDEDGRPVPETLVEIWQANAAGRYAHAEDRHAAPLDPNFSGAGRVLTNADGEFRFVTVKPGAYPWQNHDNAWRPAHVHFSVFGPSFLTRLMTQIVLPRRSPARLRSGLQRDSRRVGPPAPDRVVRAGHHRGGLGARLPLRHRAARARRHADGDLTRCRR